MLDGFIKICRVTELAAQAGKRFYVGDHPLALFMYNEKIYATDNICPHQHSNILHEGFLEQGYVVCPAHGWSYSLETGKQPDGRRGITSYPVAIEDGFVFVQFTEKKFAW